jgi:hypothetical protein
LFNLDYQSPPPSPSQVAAAEIAISSTTSGLKRERDDTEPENAGNKDESLLTDTSQIPDSTSSAAVVESSNEPSEIPSGDGERRVKPKTSNNELAASETYLSTPADDTNSTTAPVDKKNVLSHSVSIPSPSLSPQSLEQELVELEKRFRASSQIETDPCKLKI